MTVQTVPSSMNSHTPSTRSVGPQRRKAILICPECGHESPPDGDWHHRTALDATVYVCPACRTDVTRRPAESGDSLPAQTARTFESTASLVTAMWRNYAHQVAGWMRP